ncbi:MAG: L,D-transpeptidase family protein [Candidatus Spyradosoma sp.]
MLLAELKRKCEMLGVAELPDALVASVPAQRLWHFRADAPVAEYRISTSRAAPSCVKNSLGTPDGLFSVVEKIGAGAPAGTVFKARVSTGMHFSEFLKSAPDENLITSRILRIQGEEDGHNRGGDVDTYSRFVYIHGTNQEHRLGTPNSHGCLLLGNADVIALFDALPDAPAGTPVARLLIAL